MAWQGRNILNVYTTLYWPGSESELSTQPTNPWVGVGWVGLGWVEISQPMDWHGLRWVEFKIFNPWFEVDWQAEGWKKPLKITVQMKENCFGSSKFVQSTFKNVKMNAAVKKIAFLCHYNDTFEHRRLWVAGRLTNFWPTHGLVMGWHGLNFFGSTHGLGWVLG